MSPLKSLDLTVVMTGLNAAYRAAVSVAQQLKNNEMNTALSDLWAEMESLKEINRVLQEQVDLAFKMTRVGDLYWRKDGEAWTGPYCPACVAEKRLGLATDFSPSNPSDIEGPLFWFCVTHQTHFKAFRFQLAELGIPLPYYRRSQSR